MQKMRIEGIPGTWELEERPLESGDEPCLLKFSGRIPWPGEEHEYFPEEIIGKSVTDGSDQEFRVVKAEYNRDLTGDQYVTNLWVMASGASGSN